MRRKVNMRIVIGIFCGQIIFCTVILWKINCENIQTVCISPPEAKSLRLLTLFIVYLGWIAVFLQTSYMKDSQPLVTCSRCSHCVPPSQNSSLLPDSLQWIGSHHMFANVLSLANWGPVGQFSTQRAVLIIMVHEGYACFNIHLCCSSSQRTTQPVFWCWSGKYKQWSIVSVSDQLALCLWILWPAEIVCSTPQDVF